MKLYHFTSTHHLPGIRRAGLIQPTESNVGSPLYDLPPYGAHWGPDVVWLLDTDRMNGYSHGLHGSMYDKTTIRITVDLPSPIKWLDWEWTSKMNPAWKEMIVKTGGGPAAVEAWYVWPAWLQRRHWLEITNAHTGRVIWSQVGIVKGDPQE